jgi:hypothetical protein
VRLVRGLVHITTALYTDRSEMNAGELLQAIDTQDEVLSIGLALEDRVRLAVDDA